MIGNFVYFLARGIMAECARKGEKMERIERERISGQEPVEAGMADGQEPEKVRPADGQEPEKTETVLRAVVWPEPLAYDRTPEEKKHSRDFPFETEGIWQAVAWLNEEHEAGHF